MSQVSRSRSNSGSNGSGPPYDARHDGRRPMIPLALPATSRPSPHQMWRAQNLQTLPGLELDFEDAFLQFRGRTVFRTTPTKTVLSFPLAPFSKPYDLLHILAQPDVPTHSSAFASGSFNRFRTLERDEAEKVRRMVRAEGTSTEPAEKIGIRTSMRQLSEDQLLPAFEELWMLLHAASQNVHPNVHAAGIVDDRLVVIMDAGIDLTELSAVRISRGMASKLHDSLVTASEMGLLMTDIKTKNMTVIDGQIFFIDLGADFARLDDAGVKCILFVNSLLLLLYVLCNVRGVFERTFIKQLAEKVYDLSTEFKDDASPELCNVLETLNAFDRKRIDSAHSSLYRTTSVDDVACAVVERAEHYAKWWDTQCLPNFVADETIIEQILSFIVSEFIVN